MIESIQLNSLTITQVLDRFLRAGFGSGGSFAIWRKPKSNLLEFALDGDEHVKKVSLQLEELPAGFIAHPFEDQKDKEAYFIQASNYFSLELDQNFDEQELPEWVRMSADTSPQQALKSISKAQSLRNDSNKEAVGDSKDHFIELVEKGIRSIQDGLLEKVVPARTKSMGIPENFDLAIAIHRLLQASPNSFINFFHLPQIGTWLGASPEVLIETKGDEFYTMSLAGTQAAKGENPLKTAAWTQKEIEEQALVSRYIVDCFKRIRLREYDEHGPKTVMAGSLLHLRSDFRVNMKETNFPQLGTVMLDLLHPTSAVCGMPRKESHDFLKENEGFDRSFFAGFIGPVNIADSTSIFVNLRTASFQDGKVTLYAGAGVTEDSDPAKEWEETEMKCEIIGKFIQNSQA